MNEAYNKIVDILLTEVIQKDARIEFDRDGVRIAFRNDKNVELAKLQKEYGAVKDKKKLLNDIVNKAYKLGYGIVYRSFGGDFYILKVLKLKSDIRKEIKAFGDEFLNDICTFGHVSLNDLVEKNTKGFLDQIDSNFDILNYAKNKEIDVNRDEKIAKIIAGDMKRGLVRMYIVNNGVTYVSSERIWRNKDVIGGLSTAVDMALKLNKKDGFKIGKVQSDGVLVVGAYNKENKSKVINELQNEYKKIVNGSTSVDIGGKKYVCENIHNGLEIVNNAVSMNVLLNKYLAFELVRAEHGMIEFTSNGGRNGTNNLEHIEVYMASEKVLRELMVDNYNKNVTALTKSRLAEINNILNRALGCCRLTRKEVLTGVSYVLNGFGYKLQLNEIGREVDEDGEVVNSYVRKFEFRTCRV